MLDSTRKSGYLHNCGIVLNVEKRSQQAFPIEFDVHFCRCRTCCASELAFKTFATS